MISGELHHRLRLARMGVVEQLAQTDRMPIRSNIGSEARSETLPMGKRQDGELMRTSS